MKIFIVVLIYLVTSSLLMAKETYSCKKIKSISSKSDIFKCVDGSYSVRSFGYDGYYGAYEGVCGPQSAATMFYPYCGKTFDPRQSMELGRFDDITPGTRPTTLASGLNTIFSRNRDICNRGTWKAFETQNGFTFLNHAKNNMRTKKSRYKSAPFIALIKAKNGNLHYVSVMDIYFVENIRGKIYRSTIQHIDVTKKNLSKCRVRYNDGAIHKKISCSKMARVMSAANENLRPILKNYNYLLFQ